MFDSQVFPHKTRRTEILNRSTKVVWIDFWRGIWEIKNPKCVNTTL